MWGRPAAALASLFVFCSIGVVPAPAAAFGTIDGGSQNREHERITRAAMACPVGVSWNGDCFEPRSVDQLAGHGKEFGAVGAPDLTEVSDPAAHCDDADYLARGYPQTREQATASLLACVSHLRRRLQEAVASARGLLDDEGKIIDAEVNLDADCALDADAEQRAKCQSLEGFGRALHGVQDFYSHSNWADEADPARPIGAGNPPGLNLPAPSPILDLGGGSVPTVPRDLTTGCFVPRDRVRGVGVCERRVTHAALNKDNGLVDQTTGVATGPTTPRGQVGSNFAKAVAGALVETRHQWQHFRGELDASYGAEKATLMACALTRDDPSTDCRARRWAAANGESGSLGGTVVLVVTSGLLLGTLAVGLLWLRVRRRGKEAPVRSSQDDVMRGE